MALTHQIAETMAHNATASVLDAIQYNQVLAQLAAQRTLPTQQQFALLPTNAAPSESVSSRPTLGERLRKSISRARDAMMLRQPPSYCRGAWSIINDIPYPPPPPYAGTSRPPTYDDAMEIGVVASPMRVEAQRTNSSIRRAASSPGLASVGHVIGTADEDGLLPDTMVLDEVLPEYPGTGETVYSSEVVGQWRLGERAIEKPPIHPRGYRYPAARRVSGSGAVRGQRAAVHARSRSLGWTLFNSSSRRTSTSSS